MRPVRNTFNVLEQTTVLYRGFLTHEDGVTPIIAADLDTLVLTLYTENADGTTTIINGRNAQDVLNLNGVTVYDVVQYDPANQPYNLLWQATPADTAILTDALRVETHVGLWQWTSGVIAGKHEMALAVKNLVRVP